MRTTVNIPKDLIDEAKKISGASTQTTAIIMGLEELIRKRKIEALVALRGSGAIKMTQKDLRESRRR